MRAWIAATNAIYWLALALWLSAIVTAAVAAVSAFGILPDTPLVLEDFRAYAPPDDPGAHGRLAAGIVMERVFWIVDMIQFAAAPLVVIALLAQLLVLPLPSRPWANRARTLAILIAAGTFIYQAAALTPGMNRELRAYWVAARAGELDDAREHHAAFNEAHPRAEMLYQVRLLALLAAIIASAPALGPVITPTPSSGHEAPRLLNRR